jgi:hypothetical protein
MTEESKLTGSMFDFDVGLIEESLNRTVQLDTGDISYSILLLRYGYLGTLINLSLFAFLMTAFYKNRQDSTAFFSFTYFIVLIFGSFFSYALTQPVSFLLPLITYSVILKNKEEYG